MATKCHIHSYISPEFVIELSITYGKGLQDRIEVRLDSNRGVFFVRYGVNAPSEMATALLRDVVAKSDELPMKTILTWIRAEYRSRARML